jgi:ABC-type nitrate/sulfonate/bicarbonate transport system ATPase subunit
VLEIRGLRKTYPGSSVPALSDLNLDVETGEFVSLIGPSGCGKTTTIRIIAGLLEPSGGTVLMEGRPGLAPSREKAMVFQLFNLFPWRTARDNVAYGLQVQGMPKAVRRRVAEEYLDLVGLAHRADHYPAQLSGGECQRVGLARALAIEPKLLLMDEPFGSLDALTREHLQVMLQHVCAQRNLTVLFVTHSLDEAIFLSDRMIIMGNAGKVVADKSIDLKRPRDNYDWRATDEYTTLRSEAWRLLQGEFESSRARDYETTGDR